MWPWASYLSSHSLNILIFKMKLPNSNELYILRLILKLNGIWHMISISKHWYFYHHSCLEMTEKKKKPKSLKILGDWEDDGILKDRVKSGDKTDLWRKILIFGRKYTLKVCNFSEHLVCSVFIYVEVVYKIIFSISTKASWYTVSWFFPTWPISPTNWLKNRNLNFTYFPLDSNFPYKKCWTQLYHWFISNNS